MAITPTGKGLNVIIVCEYRPHHSWMSFGSWYSIFKNLPDAEVGIYCGRENLKENLFSWTNKCGVKIVQHSKDNKANFSSNILQITSDMMAVSAYDATAIGPVSAKSDENFTFVSYLEGCGKFVLSEWIDRIRSPFGIVENLFSDDLKLNEYRILKLWEKCFRTYNATV